MLFFVVLACVFLSLTFAGLNFENAFVLSVATLSNTGPLPTFFGGDVTGYDSLGSHSLAVLDISMILGRMEVLAVIALLNPEYWRR